MAPMSSPKNFHDSIRNMFSINSTPSNSTTSLAYTLENSAQSNADMLEMQKKHNNLTLKLMQEQTKILKKIANDNNAGGSGGGGSIVGDVIQYKMLRKVFGKRMAFLLSFGVEEALVAGLAGIGKSTGKFIHATIGKHVTKAFTSVAAAGRAVFRPLAGLSNAITSSGVMKMVTGLSSSFRALPKLLGKFVPIVTALFGIMDAFSGWKNAESILGKANVSFGERLAAALDSFANGFLFGIPDMIAKASGAKSVAQGLVDFGNGVSKAVSWGIKGLMSYIPTGLTLVGNAATYVTDKVYGTFEFVKNSIWDGLTYLGTAIKDSLKAVFIDTWESVKDWWNGDGKTPPALRRSGVVASSNMGAAGSSIGAMGGAAMSGGSAVNMPITPGAARAASTPPSLEPTSTGSPSSLPSVSATGTGGTGGSLGNLVAGAESEASGGYNAYNRGTSGGKILGANGPEDLENMTINELMRRQSLPADDPNRIFAAGKYQVIPATMREAVTSLGLSGEDKFSKDTQERIFRNYLVGNKRPAIRDYITGKSGDRDKAVESLAYEFASFGGTNGFGKYGGGNKVSVGPERSGSTLDLMRATYQQNIASGMSETEAYNAAFGASSPKSGPYVGPAGDGMSIVGNFKNRGAENVNANLTDILNKAAMDPEIAAKYKVEAYSGYRPGDPRRHGKGQAIDMRLIDRETGRVLENYQNAEDFREYEKFAQKAKLIQQRDYPKLEDQFRWGGYFSGGKGKYGAVDTMHFDLTPGVGMGGGSWAKGLTPEQRRLFPGVISEGIASTSLASTATPTTGGMSLVEGGPKPTRGPGMGQLIGNRKSLPTPVTGVSGATAYQSSLAGADVMAGPKSFDDIVKNTSSRSPIDISGRGGKSAVPSYSSLISKQAVDYNAPVNNPQTGGFTGDTTKPSNQQASNNPGSHSVMDIPALDEWKMMLGNGSALT